MVDTLEPIVDMYEKVASPRTRAGATVERVGKMRANNVDDEVIALQMTKNSPNGHTYTESDVQLLGRIYEDSKTRVLITAKQAKALVCDAREAKEPSIGFAINQA